MISYEEALRLIAAEAKLQSHHRVDRYESFGQVAANDINAALAIPSFNNSAMDGFALSAELTRTATEDNPLVFQVSDCLAAGDVLQSAVDGMAVEIMTGAKMPAGCDAVVPVEDVESIVTKAGRTIEIKLRKALAPFENVRLIGEDFTQGQIIAKAGTRLNAGHIAAMAATGIHEVRVYNMPDIEVFATGKEVSDAYHVPLSEGEIYNANTPYLLSQLKAAGIPASYAGNIGDDPAAFTETLNVMTRSRIVISSGAVSKGKWDFIPALLTEHGARIIFHGVAIKPGKPILFAVLKDGRYYFGLPGNPIATAVGLRFFVMPLVRHLLNMPSESFHYAALRSPAEKKGKLRHFLKARLDSDHHGQSRLTLLKGQESFKISPMLDMNCWAIVDEASNVLHKDQSFNIASLELFPSAL